MATVYIRGNGNDTTGAGTLGNPWLTISKAVTSSTAGDTIVCIGGAGDFTLANQTFSSSRIIEAYPGTTPVFDGGGAIRQWQTSATISITGLTFTDAQTDFQGLMKGNFAGAILNLTNCIFHGVLCDVPPYYSLFGAAAATAYNIVGCLIYDITRNSGAAPFAGLFSDSYGPLTIAFHNNTVYSNELAANTVCFGCSPNNTFTLELKNNIIWNANGTDVVWDTNALEVVTGSNNLILGYSTNKPTLADQLATDPLFVDAASANFNLRPTSPAIDVGVII